MDDKLSQSKIYEIVYKFESGERNGRDLVQTGTKECVRYIECNRNYSSHFWAFSRDTKYQEFCYIRFICRYLNKTEIFKKVCEKDITKLVIRMYIISSFNYSVRLAEALPSLNSWPY